MVQQKQNLRMITDRDPVCGKQVEVEQSLLSLVYRGVIYHFCSAHCQERFADIPPFYPGPKGLADIRPIPKRRRLRLTDGNQTNLPRA